MGGVGRPFKLDLKNRFLMLLVYCRLYITYTLAGFLFDLDQSNVCRNIQKIENLVRQCVPIPQKIYNKTKRLKTIEEVEQYFPGFLAFIDSTEQPIPRPADKNKRKIFYSGKKKRHTSVKVTNRGQWMQDKWHLKNKKAYLKIHVAVNVKTKKILSMRITDEQVHDSKALPELVNGVIESYKQITIGKLFADGAYDGIKIFRFLADNGIQPCIKVRKNARVRWKRGNILRNLSVLSQKNDLQKWKGSVSYGQRWIVETVFSCLKRRFGEYVYSVKLQNMIQEMMLKAIILSFFSSL